MTWRLELYRWRMKWRAVLHTCIRAMVYFLGFKFRYPSQTKRLLIVKNDALGDYIIFRNFIEALQQHPHYKVYEVYLMVHPRVMPLAQLLDQQFVKGFIECPQELYALKTQLHFFTKLWSYRFDRLLHPTYSPNAHIERMVSYSKVKHKITYSGDTSNISLHEQAYYAPFYTQLIEAAVEHEFEKQKLFFSTILGANLLPDKPTLKRSRAALTNLISICPGASNPRRSWLAANHLQLIRALHQWNSNLIFRVITGPGEAHFYESIQASSPIAISHGEPNGFAALIDALSESALVICMDSAPAHLSVALDVKHICISNGNHYRRFVPYPFATSQTCVWPPQLEEAMAREPTKNPFYAGSNLDINTISVEKVFHLCKSMLQ